MQPHWQIFADRSDITATMAERVVSLHITDEAGIQSDTLEIKLDDREGILSLPRTGAELEVYLGYEETGLTYMGLFVVDELMLEGPPQTLTIKAHAADMRQSFKSQKTRSWQRKTLGEIIQTIAITQGYTPKIGSEFASILLPHIDQVQESDLHFITRLASQYGAVAKPSGKHLLFIVKGLAKSASGKELPVHYLTPQDVSTWRVTLAEREAHGSVIASWHDTENAILVEEKIGNGDPIYRLRGVYTDSSNAKAAADSKYATLTRYTATLSLTMPGNPLLLAETKLHLSNFRIGVDQEWLITKAEHNLDNSGYRTSIEAETLKR